MRKNTPPEYGLSGYTQNTKKNEIAISKNNSYICKQQSTIVVLFGSNLLFASTSVKRERKWTVRDKRIISRWRIQVIVLINCTAIQKDSTLQISNIYKLMSLLTDTTSITTYYSNELNGTRRKEYTKRYNSKDYHIKGSFRKVLHVHNSSSASSQFDVDNI